jgi:hypothetical protein
MFGPNWDISEMEETSPMQSNLILSLPRELIIEIGTYWEWRDLVQLCQVNRSVNELCSDEFIWKQLYQRDISAKRLPPSGNYRQVYRQIVPMITCSNADTEISFNAAKNGYEKLIETMINRGVTMYYTFLMGAAEGGHDDIFTNMLIKYNSRDGCFNILEQAARGGNQSIVNQALELCANVNGISYGFAMREAAEGGHINIVKQMFDLGVSPHYYTMTAAAAARNGRHEILNLMIHLSQGQISYDCVMWSAAEGGCLDIVRQMLDRGSRDYNNAIFEAERHGHHQITDFLKQHQAASVGVH